MWVVSWSSLSVPLSPWAMAMIAVLLMFATYAYKRRAHGLFGACLIVALGGAALQYRDAEANFVSNQLEITTPSGSGSLACAAGMPVSQETENIKAAGMLTLTVTNATNVPVNLVEVTYQPPQGTLSPLQQNQITAAKMPTTECVPGLTLNPAASCTLPCSPDV